jgi:hypothetical protein
MHVRCAVGKTQQRLPLAQSVRYNNLPGQESPLVSHFTDYNPVTLRFEMASRRQPSLSRLLFWVTVFGSVPHALTASDGSAQEPLWSFVDPLIGTVGPRPGSAIAGGNSFPGASLPWAMAKPGIDTSYIGLPNGSAVDANAGYTPLGNVTAVSMTHVSGSGGAPTCPFSPRANRYQY